MTLKLHIPDNRELKPRLTVFGVGGAGGNAVNNMIRRSLDGVDFVVANTDAQALALNDASFKIQLGEELTEGLGAGAKPEVGASAAEESLERIIDVLKGSHMCFITAGMGGGTGTGAAPIIAQAARELGILTVGVVTKPFTFEGGRRMKLADEGVKELQQFVDTLIIIPNQNLFLLANEKTTFSEAFGMADDVLYQGVKGVTDLMVRPGMVNLDFADIRSVMDEMGKAMMGTGEAEGENRAIEAAERAIDNPLLDEVSLRGARGVLINITGGDDMSLFEVDEASNKIREQVDPEANIIFGSTIDPELNGRIRVSVVATGIDAEQSIPKGTTQPRKPEVAEEPVKAEPVRTEPDLFGEARAPEPKAAVVEQPAFVPPAPAASEYNGGYEETFERAAEPREIQATSQYQQPNQVQETRPVAESDEAHRSAVLERMQKAVAAEPQKAPSLENELNEQPQERRRIGLDAMFRRMTGTEGVSSAEAPKPNRTIDVAQNRQVAPVQREHDLNESERERVDIPAFLRRQAN